MIPEDDYAEELLLLAETIGDVKMRAERLEAEFASNAKPIEHATGAISAALVAINVISASLDSIRAMNSSVIETRLNQLEKRLTSR